jgi:hypothetical protein
MRRKALAGFVIHFAAVLLVSGSASATSVVVRVSEKRITIAADVLARRMYTSAAGPYSACKIVSSGNSAFAVAGNIDYQKTNPMDTVAEWDARMDARQAFELYPDNLHAAAKEWAARAVQHYSSFLAAQPGRVRELSGANPQHVLVLGTFTGWSAQNSPTLIFEWVYLNVAAGPVVKSKAFVLTSRKLPFTTNATTQELIEGNSARTIKTLLDWQIQSQRFPRQQQGWRWLEFLVQSTGDYDRTVGRQVNVLQLTLGASPHWLQNYSCREP